jgi:hypothetical protein
MVDLVFECLEAQADLVAQLLEPFARFGLFFFDVVGQSDRQAWALHWGSSSGFGSVITAHPARCNRSIASRLRQIVQDSPGGRFWAIVDEP